MCNSLTNSVMPADKFWSSQEVIYNYHSQIQVIV